VAGDRRSAADEPVADPTRLPSPSVRTPLARLRLGAGLVALVFLIATIGYRIIGLSWIDAAYQTTTTITTVGFRELHDFSDGEQLFTMFIIVTGVSTVLYTFTLGVQVVVEGQIRDVVGRRRMDKKIAQLHGHVVLCGWGRVGRAIADDLVQAGRDVVVIDSDPERVASITLPTVVGDATLDATLTAAGLERADALIVALAGDAENLFVTLTGRAMQPDLFIVARAREDESIGKLTRAGADRVVNPQELGAARMASFVLQPNVAEFVDVVMHDRSHEFRMQEVMVPPESHLAGRSLRDGNLRQESGALVLAIRSPDGAFITNPDPDMTIEPHHVIIAVGTEVDLKTLIDVVNR